MVEKIKFPERIIEVREKGSLRLSENEKNSKLNIKHFIQYHQQSEEAKEELRKKASELKQDITNGFLDAWQVEYWLYKFLDNVFITHDNRPLSV